MIVTVSGLPASGTTKVAQGVKPFFSGTVTYVNAGDVFRGMADDLDMSVSEFSKHVNENPNIDLGIDGVVRAITKAFVPRDFGIDPDSLPVDVDMDADHLLLEGRLAGWVGGKYARIKIWMNGSQAVRKQRAKRTGTDPEQLIERENDEQWRYSEWYGIEIENTEIYDLIVNTARWSEQSTITSVGNFIKNYNEEFDHTIEAGHSAFEQFDSVIPDYVYE